MEENKLGSGGIPNYNGNLYKHLNLLTVSILNLEPDKIVSIFAEGACDITCLIVELQFSRDVNGLKSIGRNSVGDIDLNAEFVVLVVGEKVLLFWL